MYEKNIGKSKEVNRMYVNQIPSPYRILPFWNKDIYVELDHNKLTNNLKLHYR